MARFALLRGALRTKEMWRSAAGVALVEPDASTFYGPGAKGYTDYPAMKPA